MERWELINHIKQKGSFLCVGLDPDPLKIPEHLRSTSDGIEIFCKEIIKSTSEHCVAYKPNLAFFEALGPEGLLIFNRVLKAIPSSHLIIADAKRGDIGNTAEQYSKAFFNVFGADAITISPYMGIDTIRPFTEQEGKWAVVLALTSNPGSSDFQKQILADGQLLYEKVVSVVVASFSDRQVMFVAGATHGNELKRLRELAPTYFFLVPGIGAQGGDLKEVTQALITKEIGFLINASRSIIYASSGLDFAHAAAREARKLHEEMKALMAKV